MPPMGGIVSRQKGTSRAYAARRQAKKKEVTIGFMDGILVRMRWIVTWNF
jgi:hypothetical protein